jgi:protein-S-isoprenylcysteine O-methyltransferase Ste14
VIVNGPYQWVRHPGYAAAIIAALASGVALGSWFSTAIAAIAVPLLLWRTHGEDRLLEEGLPGYKDYAERVRYKLAPGIW